MSIFQKMFLFVLGGPKYVRQHEGRDIFAKPTPVARRAPTEIEVLEMKLFGPCTRERGMTSEEQKRWQQDYQRLQTLKAEAEAGFRRTSAAA